MYFCSVGDLKAFGGLKRLVDGSENLEKGAPFSLNNTYLYMSGIRHFENVGNTGATTTKIDNPVGPKQSSISGILKKSENAIVESCKSLKSGHL